MKSYPPLYLLPVQPGLRLRFAAIVVCVLVGVAGELALGQFIRAMVDAGLTEEDLPRLRRQLGGMLLLLLGLTVATWLRLYWVNSLSERVAAAVRCDLFGALLRMDGAFFDRQRTADLTSRLTTDAAMIQSALGLTMSMAMRNSLIVVGAVTLLVITSPRLATITLVLVSLTVIPLIYIARRLRRDSAVSQAGIADVGAFASERLDQISTVQSYVAEERELAAFRHWVDEAMRQGIRRGKTQSLLSSLATGLSFAAMALMIALGTQDVLAGRITLGELVTFLFYALYAAGAIGNLSEVFSQWQRAAGAWSRCTELLQETPSIRPPAKPESLPDGVPLSIAFDRVTFSYPGRPTEAVLKELSLEVEAGTSLALVGPSGGGKSTLFRLATRMYDVHEGAVRVGGIDVRELDPAELRRHLAVVPQEPAMFAGTIRENIAYGNPNCSDEELRSAAEAAAATEFIDQLPDKFETQIGTRGLSLSGGQRQRLAIARAIVSGARVLLFDEATSALDSENERLIQRAMQNIAVGRTVLIIAHRLSTVQWADKIAVIESGRCTAVGTHDELLDGSGLYERLVRAQWLGGDSDEFSPEPAGTP